MGASTLLIQSCSARKRETENPTPALEVYDGYFFRIIRKAIRTTGLSKELDLVILSAKHGIIRPETPIAEYDLEMTSSRAAEMRAELLETVRELVEENEYEKIVLNVGKPYRDALQGIESLLDAQVEEISGSGIGDKGRALKAILYNGLDRYAQDSGCQDRVV